jgi:type VI protein secretion system component Hcp
MSIELALPGRPPAPCVRYQLHVHAELTRDRRAADPRVPGRSRHEDALVSREPDALSPWLFYCCAAGVRVDEVRVVLRHDPPPDGPPAEAAGEAPDHTPTELSPAPSAAPPAPGGAAVADPKAAPQPNEHDSFLGHTGARSRSTIEPAFVAQLEQGARKGPLQEEASGRLVRPASGEGGECWRSGPHVDRGSDHAQPNDLTPGAERMTFTLHDVYVVSVLSSMEDGRPLETVALSYGRVTWSVPDGESTTWDVYAARQEAP